ncbi:MAG TPA: LamG domain-containing protein, partial [Candidatus Limnocylindria bacterium]|nr:LamG domain-containing protein [Candidatus Limnocylindria bacterium]
KFNELLTPGAATPGLQYLMFKRRPANSGFEGYALVKDRLSGADRLKLVLAKGAGVAEQVVITGTTVVETNRFYFVAGTADGTQARLYVNGVLEGQSAAPFLIQSGTRPLVFGSSEESYNGRFSGVLDEPQIFNRALSQAEIQALYDQASVAPRLVLRRIDGGVEFTWPARFATWPLELSSEMQIWVQEPMAITRTGYTLSAGSPANGEAGFMRLREP